MIICSKNHKDSDSSVVAKRKVLNTSSNLLEESQRFQLEFCSEEESFKYLSPILNTSSKNQLVKFKIMFEKFSAA